MITKTEQAIRDIDTRAKYEATFIKQYAMTSTYVRANVWRMLSDSLEGTKASQRILFNHYDLLWC